jgi:aromatic ring-opening dioxygenase LigB subunit
LSEADSLFAHLDFSGVNVCFNESHDLTRDQGSLVPLYFLEDNFDGLPPTILASPIGLDIDSAFEMGKALSSYDDGNKWGLMASGDLSHRLKPGAPAGFSPEGKVFDKAVVEALKNGDASVLRDLSNKTLEEAGECGLRSVMVMLGISCGMGESIDVISYEGPFGVGYCNAIWASRV